MNDTNNNFIAWKPIRLHRTHLRHHTKRRPSYYPCRAHLSGPTAVTRLLMSIMFALHSVSSSSPGSALLMGATRSLSS